MAETTTEEAPAAPAPPTVPGQIYAPWKPKFNPWIVALTVTLATFMEVLDTSIANVALPHIAGRPFGVAGRSHRGAHQLPCVERGLLCGLLVLFRVLQGLGEALATSEQAILADTFSPEKRGMAFAIYGMAVVMAPAVPHAGRVDNRQLQLAMDLLSQRSGRDNLALPHTPHRGRSALHGIRAAQDAPQLHRLRGTGSDRRRHWLPAGGARQGSGRRLVFVPDDRQSFGDFVQGFRRRPRLLTSTAFRLARFSYFASRRRCS